MRRNLYVNKQTEMETSKQDRYYSTNLVINYLITVCVGHYGNRQRNALASWGVTKAVGRNISIMTSQTVINWLIVCQCN